MARFPVQGLGVCLEFLVPLAVHCRLGFDCELIMVWTVAKKRRLVANLLVLVRQSFLK